MKIFGSKGTEVVQRINFNSIHIEYTDENAVSSINCELHFEKRSLSCNSLSMLSSS